MTSTETGIPSSVQELASKAGLVSPKMDINDVSKVSARDIFHRLCEGRDFEISNVWNRSVFLAAFLIACLSGYGGLLLSCHNAGRLVFMPVTNTILWGLTLVGIVLSCLWIGMSKGSKAWFEVYEYAIISFASHSDIAMSDIMTYTNARLDWINTMGKEQRTALSQKLSNNPFSCKGGRFSVSKINIVIGHLTMFIFFVLSIFHILYAAVMSFPKVSGGCDATLWTSIAIFLRNNLIKPNVMFCITGLTVLLSMAYVSFFCNSSSLKHVKEKGLKK